MELKDTIEMMVSEDYVERFRAEFEQTRIRYHKLYGMLIKFKAGTLNFTPKCSYDVLEEQLWTMRKYLMQLEVRAEIEGIKL